MSCEFCCLDEVTLFDVPYCVLDSLRAVLSEIGNGTFDLQTLLLKDRIYYIILVVILLSLFHMLRTNKYQQPDQSIWELDTRWNPQYSM